MSAALGKGILFVWFLAAAPALAAEDLPALQAAFLRGEYETVVRGTRSLLGEGSGKAETDSLLYLQGVSALKLRDFDLARSSLGRLLEDHPQSTWAGQAWLALGDSWEASGNDPQALDGYGRVLRESAAEDLHPQAALRLGKVQRRMGVWQGAKETLESVAARWPETPEGAQAREFLAGGDFYFTVQVGAFVSRSNALKLAAELKRRGYDAEVGETAMQGRIFHRVRVGRFLTKQEAEEMARRLQGDGFPGKVFP